MARDSNRRPDKFGKIASRQIILPIMPTAADSIFNENRSPFHSTQNQSIFLFLGMSTLRLGQYLGQSNLFPGSIDLNYLLTCLRFSFGFISFATGDGRARFAGRWCFIRSIIGGRKSPSPPEPHHALVMNVQNESRLTAQRSTIVRTSVACSIGDKDATSSPFGDSVADLRNIA
jgi:hypothetical protein